MTEKEIVELIGEFYAAGLTEFELDLSTGRFGRPKVFKGEILKFYLDATKNDLLNMKDILDRVNELDYNINDIEELQKITDTRFIPILLSKLGQYDNPNFQDADIR
jgi:hypothetical protein